MIETTFECHPKPKMRKGDRCWCLSGRRWKDCHMNRAKLPKSTIEDYYKAQAAARHHTQCLHPNAPHNCSGSTIRSHSVQKNTSLKAIEKNNHVLTIGAMSFGEIERKKDSEDIIRIEKNGINKASTFPGFCNNHDTELFKPVETKGWRHSKENAFLLSLRAISIEYFKKKSVLAFLEWCLNNADRGDNFEEQAWKQIHYRSAQIAYKHGYHDLYKALKKYHEIYCSKDFSNYKYICIEFDRKCPIVSCGAFTPEYDFQGQKLQDIANNELEEVCVNIYSSENSSLCIFGYLDGPLKVGKRFTESLLSEQIERIPNIISQLALSSFENTYFNEDWNNNLTDEEKFLLLRLLKNNANPEVETSPTYLKDCGWNIFYGKVSEIYK